MKKTFLTLSIASILSGSAYAQFKQFKAPTQYDSNNQNEAPASKLLDDDTSGEDVFGREATDMPKTDSKYVNLNPETAFGPEVITSFDFPNTSLQDLTNHMQKLTGLNLIVDKDLKGKISISAPTPITVGDAWKAYLSALNMNGLAIVKSGAFYKIVQARDIRYVPTKIYTGNFVPETENYIMKIIALKNIDSTEVSRSFRPFMSRYGRIIEIKQTNTIIVQDTGENINRLMRLIKFIDVPGHEETLQIIKVKNTSATEIAKLLDAILKKDTTKKFNTTKTQNEVISKITAEPRTNSIIAMANADGARRLNELIEKLDVKLIAANNEQVHVYYLFHGDAEELSKTLSTLVSNAAKQTSTATSRFSRTATAQDTTNSLFNAEVRVTADKSNNALVVTASPTDWLTLEKVIRKLDVKKEQVFVEGLIMETNVSKSKNVGVSIIGAYGTGAADRAGFIGGESGSNLMNLLSNQWQSLGGLFIGASEGRGITTTVGGSEIKVGSVNALISAIANNGNSNVLATPQLLVQDNTEGVFEVGEQIPVPERTNASNGSSTTSIKQQKVALTLKITPQINKVTRYIKMKIDQKIDDFSNRQLPSGLAAEGVGTNTRSTVTTVTVRDRDTIAMGGLMRDRTIDSESKVPLLGDIPVLGWLFKNQTKQIEKVNMLFFLTPKILTNYEQDVAGTVKDELNRRATHLQEVHGENDPFGPTAKGLYEKAKNQEEGPLYNKEDAEYFKRQNEESIQNEGYINSQNSDQSVESPNYTEIIQTIKTQKSATQKTVNQNTVNQKAINQ